VNRKEIALESKERDKQEINIIERDEQEGR